MKKQKKEEKIDEVCIPEDLFSELDIQVGTLKEIYNKIEVETRMSAFQKKILLKNKKKNKEVLMELEVICSRMWFCNIINTFCNHFNLLGYNHLYMIKYMIWPQW